jgi:hypothetical protein
MYTCAAGGVCSQISCGQGLCLSMDENYRRHRRFLARMSLSDYVNVYRKSIIVVWEYLLEE